MAWAGPRFAHANSKRTGTKSVDERTRRTIADIALAALTLCGAGLLLYGAMSLPPPRFEPLGSAALPRILASLLILFALIISATALFRHRQDTSIADATIPRGARADPRKGVLVLAALIAYVFALDALRIPFTIVTPFFVTATGLAIGTRSWRNLVAFAILGLLLALAISTVLERFLYVRIG
ncbi:MAG TPA: hypothetical protein DHU16_02510 [Gammaproteobacteria bacterium]|nr:hypothetical protein [Gammaproteobacteria bacterium]